MFCISCEFNTIKFYTPNGLGQLNYHVCLATFLCGGSNAEYIYVQVKANLHMKDKIKHHKVLEINYVSFKYGGYKVQWFR